MKKFLSFLFVLISLCAVSASGRTVSKGHHKSKKIPTTAAVGKVAAGNRSVGGASADRGADADGMAQAVEYARMGSNYLQGTGVAEDGGKAREYFKRSAELGFPRGMALYASLLGTNNGGAIDYPDSFFWFYVAGELGDNYSRVMLYRPRVPEAEADNEVGKDAQTALTWIELVHSGKSMKNEPVYKDGFLKGLKERELAAERGDDWSRFYLGGMNYNGDFLNQNYGQALRYYEAIAANDNLPRPMLVVVHERLADMYRHGKGVKANSAKASSHERLAAKYK